MIATDAELVMSPSEADDLMPWPLDVLERYAASGRLFYEGTRVRIVSRFQ